MAVNPRRRSLLKWVGLLVLILGASSGLLVWEAFRRARPILLRYEAERAGFFASLRARDPRRPSLFGTDLPGNAWDAYENGFRAIAPHLQGSASWGKTPWESWEEARFQSLLVRCGPAIKDLLTGLQTGRVVPRFHYEEGEGMDRALGTADLYTARLCEEVSKRMHERGLDRQAIESLWIALGIQQDVARRGGTGCLYTLRMMEREVAEGCETILSAHRLSAGDLETLTAMLDRLEAGRPSTQEELEIALWMEPRAVEGERLTRPGWRSLFRRDLHRAVAVTAVEDVRVRLNEIFSLPRHLRFNEANRRQSECGTADRGDESLAWYEVSRACYQEAVSGMNDTLMRVALAIAWYEAEKSEFPGKLEDLVPKYLPKVPTCPFSGVPLGYAAGKVWSIGFDSRDDGGKPISKIGEAYQDIGWRWSPIPGDVVWSVARK